ncbi:hypothetical protein [Streptomyces odontomachi]|uniref:hypothetical protein n=1 Tax=Streptomyces odontomachi TaxID=2944940 RepID=UPI00210BDFD3|nr:hypothetical protein [Streptomyces sp. ODS25]
MAHDQDATPARAPREHRTITTEQGRFCFARCDCGWRGPARRARSLARTDAQDHAASATATASGTP